MSRTVLGKCRILVLMAILLFVMFPNVGDSASHVVFSMGDRADDDFGYGSVVYPLHEVFEPGLFDLRRVHIWYDDQNTYFDISFALINNPWNAPEGFFHQLIDVYIDAEPGGHTVPVAPGAGVRFSPEAGWEYRLRIQPWGGSRWLDARSDPAKAYPVIASVLPDDKTIRAQVPFSVADPPSRVWQYYVLVGGFDTFGPDQYRIIQETATQWSFGGAVTPDGPNVIDLLDSGFGKKAQKNQLEAHHLAEGEYPVVLPVSHGLSLPFTWGHLLSSLAVLLLLGSIFYIVFRQQPPGHAG